MSDVVNDGQLVIYSPRKKLSSVKALDFFMALICLSAAFVCVYFFYLSLTQTLTSDLEPVGSVSVRYNSVQRRMGDRILWDRIFNESLLYPGDIIRVSEYSGAVLHFDGNDIELDENTLIRVTVGSSGQPQIVLDSGTLNLISAQDSGSINLVVGGRTVEAGQGTVLSVSDGDEGMVLMISEGSVMFVDETGQAELIAAGTVITQDETGIGIDYTADIILERFQWMETERAMHIISQAAYNSGQEAGSNEQGAGSNEQIIESVEQIISVEPEAQPPLGVPVLLQPAAGYRLGPAEIRSLNSIDFSWSAVSGANAYIFTLFHQTVNGQRQIVRTAPLTLTRWSLSNFNLLDVGIFTWQVEAINRDTNGTILQQSPAAQRSFNVDIPTPQIREQTVEGRLYVSP